jgi:NADPH-dependent glutamate synthase beta subunit-like oxidoreductase
MKKKPLLKNNLYLTDAQLKNEFAKCEFCEEKPCRDKCPADCSAADFIMAANVFDASDLKRSAAQIMKNNPLGGVCGLVCPDKFCMAACVHKKFDAAVNIPAVQATIGRHPEVRQGEGQRQKSRHRGLGPGRPGRGSRPRPNGLQGRYL